MIALALVQKKAEQNFRFCERIVDRAYILEKGMIQYEGNMGEIAQNEEVVNKYLAV